MAERLTLTPLPYAKWHDAEALFTPFATEPWALLLDSAGSSRADGRYDMLLREPVQTIDSRTTTTPFADLQAALQQLPSPPGAYADQVPFVGGAAGYFSYDAGRLLEQLPATATRDINLPDMALGLYTRALIIDHQQQQSWALSPASEAPTVNSYWLGTAEPQTPFALTSDWQSNMSAADYEHNIARIHHYLRAGDCYQVNLAQRFQASFRGSSWQAYQRLRAHNQAPFSAFFNGPEGQVLSLSPERFLQTTAAGCIATSPIKGTRPRRQDPVADEKERESLRQSTKDRAENLMIVDLLRNDLSRVCLPGSLRVPDLFTLESYAAVHHLVSTIRARLPAGKTPLDLLQAAFPGGSITGAPKIRAMEIIEELEPHRRSVYCGSLGYLSQDGQSDTSIAIRTLVATAGQLYCWAGGGIVMDSEAQTEYQETFDKVQRILPILSDTRDSAKVSSP